MRNPIQPSPDRPVPLPDCILMDGWWAVRHDLERERPETLLRHVAHEPQSGHRDQPGSDVRNSA